MTLLMELVIFKINLKKLNQIKMIEIVGVRDYIHISDLAVGHSCALKKIAENPGLKVKMQSNEF